MTVSELINVLKTYKQDMHVVYKAYSEHCMLNVTDLRVQELCVARPDGWVENKRGDKATVNYLVFPGN